MPLNETQRFDAFKDKLHQIILQKDLSQYQQFVAECQNEEMRQELVKDSLYSLALHDVLAILNHVLTLDYVVRYLATDQYVVNTLLHAAIKSQSVTLLNVFLAMPRFSEYLTKYPQEFILEAAKSSLPVFKKVIEFIEIGENLDAWNNVIFFGTLIGYKRDNMNYLMQFPKVFEYVDCVYDCEEGSTKDHVAKFLEYYFPELESRIRKFKSANHQGNFDVDSKEAKLGFLILRNLVKTYDKRHELKNRAIFNLKISLDYYTSSKFEKAKHKTKDLLFSCVPNNTNVHLKRVKLLLSIPAIRAMANKNDNQLLKIALSLVDAVEVTTILRGVDNVKKSEQEQPIDVQFALANPIDLKKLYEESYPSAELGVYLGEALDRANGNPIGTHNLKSDDVIFFNNSDYTFSAPRFTNTAHAKLELM